MIAWLLAQLLCLADLAHCTRLAWTAGGPRCVEVRLDPPCCSHRGWHMVLWTPVCVRDCAGGRPTT